MYLFWGMMSLLDFFFALVLFVAEALVGLAAIVAVAISLSFLLFLTICYFLLSGEKAYLVELFLSLADAAVEGLLHE